MGSTKCLVCLKNCSPKENSHQDSDSDEDIETADECETVKKQLPAIFLLRKFLDIPQDICCKFLEDFGDPCTWILCCDACSVRVDRARRVCDKIASLQTRYKKLQTEFKAAIISSIESQNNNAPNSSSQRGVNEIVRNHIKNGKLRKLSVSGGGQAPGTSGSGGQAPGASGSGAKIPKAPIISGDNGPEASGRVLRNKADKPTEKIVEVDPPADKGKATGKKPGPASRKRPGRKPGNKKKNNVTAEKKIEVFSGAGHKLSEPPGCSTSTSQNSNLNVFNAAQSLSQPQKANAELTDEKKRAAAAALARFESAKKPNADPEKLLASRQSAFIKEMARQEIEKEKQSKELGPQVHGSTDDNTADVIHIDETEEGNMVDVVHSSIQKPNSYIVSGVYFHCPIIGFESFPKAEIELKIKEFLLDQPQDDMSTACLMIHSCNRQREKVEMCVETLCKYLENIIKNPGDQLFRKIRCTNKIYQERVAGVFGAKEFLSAAGFVKKVMKNDSSGENEDFWVLTTEVEEDDVSFLSDLRNVLQNTDPIVPILDRNVQVLKPGNVNHGQKLPEDFYELSSAEIKREQRLKADLVDKETTLRTKAQREKDKIKSPRRIYRYCVIRVKFPDQFILQGTFASTDKILDLYDFVSKNLCSDEIEFVLKKSGGEFLDNTNATLADCDLTPATVVIFTAQTAPPSLATGEVPYLKPEILESAQALE